MSCCGFVEGGICIAKARSPLISSYSECEENKPSRCECAPVPLFAQNKRKHKFGDVFSDPFLERRTVLEGKI